MTSSLTNWLRISYLIYFNSFHHYLCYLKLFSFSLYFPYIWDVNKLIHKVSVLMIPTGAEFLCVEKILLTTELHIFFFILRNLSDLETSRFNQMRKILIFQLVFSSPNYVKTFGFFDLSFYQLLSFSNRLFLFLISGILHLLFQWFLKRL